MATLEHRTENRIPPTIQERLQQLRWWIRAYVSWEGLMAALVWLGLAFWATLLVDWFFEPLRQVRVAFWLVVAGGLAAIVFWQVLRRLVVRFTEANLAMILERRFPELNETLLTAVEVAARPDRAVHFSPQMLALACREAERRLQPLRLRDVFNFLPLYRVTVAALLLATSILMWAVIYPEAFGVWWDRMVGLSDRLWPRRTVLLVEGFDRPVKVGRGGDVELLARVDLEKSLLIPSAIYIRGRTEDGARIRATMNRIGNAQPGKDKYQDYAYTFQGLLSDVRFDLHGGDAWIEGLEIDVVDNPTVARLELEYEYPAYMARPRRSVEVTGVMPVPQGTKLTIHATANKDLELVQIHSVLEPNRPPVVLRYRPQDAHWRDRQHFRYTIESLEQDTALLFTLSDTDGIRSREPIRLSLAAVPDEKPQLEVRLRGIGQAITPQARIPAVGRLTDDYGLARIWWEYTIQTPPEKSARSESAKPEKTGEKPTDKPSGAEKATSSEKSLPSETAKEIQIASFGNPPTEHLLDTAVEASELDLRPGQKLLLALKASDRCDRQGGPNVGSSDRWMLDVVTPDQLRLMLEARELTLRQRFEVIIREVEETRELLSRMEFPSSAAKEPVPPKPQPTASGALAVPDRWPFAALTAEGAEVAEKPIAEPSAKSPGAAGSPGSGSMPAPAPEKPLSIPPQEKPPAPPPEKPMPETAPEKPKAENPTAENTPPAAKPSAPEAERPAPAALEPGEETETAPARTPEQIRNRALLAVQRAQNTLIKDKNDILEIADAFDQIREELINNRIDSEKLRRRLKEGIADPLRRAAQEPMPRLEQRLHELEATLDHPEEGPRNRLLAVQQLDALLVQLQEILHQMIELETFNEVVATLRAIIEEQEKLHQETQRYHKERLRKLLEE